MTKVTVAIPTIGRETLRKTLASLEEQIHSADLDVEILVIDDTPDLSVARSMADLHMGNVRYLASGRQNIAHARNVCLDHATGDFILFIDDDETAPSDWISSMVAQIEGTDADCLFAPVKPVYRKDAPDWLMRLEPLFPSELKTAMKQSRVVGRTGNSIVRKSFIDRNGLRFDPHFRAAGEDLHFYHLCLRAGARALAVNAPELEECVCVRYHRIGPVLSKLYRRGQAYADVRCRLSQQTGRELLTMSGAAFMKLAATVVAFPFALLFGRQAWMRLAFRVAMEAGKMRGLGAYTLRSNSS
ncbi:glycosyltransferase family 2 protein [Roseibium sp.]|uniref:glycosyltransferase family 2 protein n=1 Tax=Roseibium sp. TaxID=1936156 RepID=UPI0039EEC87D